MSDDRGRGHRELAEILRADLRIAEVESPSFERLADYVEGRLSPDERAAIDERLAGDEVLRAEVEGLRELHGQLGGRTSASRPRTWVLAGLAAAAALAIAVWLRTPEPPRAPDRASAAAASPTPAPAAAFRDGDLRLALAADGGVSGLPALDPARRAAVEAALRGELPQPGGLDALRGGRGALMGAAPSVAFAPVAPVATRVGSGRPVFRWTAHADARAYEVAVYDQDFHRQAASGPVTGTEWRPATPLAEGRVYLWQVSADTGRGRVTVPAPPAPEARFEVATPAVRAAIDAQRSPAPASRLLAALAFVEAGLLDDAEREIEALAGENPGSPEVARLREGLRALR